MVVVVVLLYMTLSDPVSEMELSFSEDSNIGRDFDLLGSSRISTFIEKWKCLILTLAKTEETDQKGGHHWHVEPLLVPGSAGCEHHQLIVAQTRRGEHGECCLSFSWTFTHEGLQFLEIKNSSFLSGQAWSLTAHPGVDAALELIFVEGRGEK